MSDYISKGIAVVIPFLGALPASDVTRREIKTWYKLLKKPWFKPPNYVFGPVWTTLYCMMGYSSYLVWHHGGGFNRDTCLPLSLYGSQLLLNWAWSIIFFGRHKIGWAAVESGMLWVNVLACVITFRRVDETASNMLLPYLAWGTLATALNVSLWRLNKHDSSLSE